MIVLDVETTGTEAAKHSLVSIGAVDFENPSRKFSGECRIWDGAHIIAEALVINGMSREEIVDPKKKSDVELAKEFMNWAVESPDHTIAGQNPFLDIDFIKWTAMRGGINFTLSRRSIDLHTTCYLHMTKRGIAPPVEKGRTSINSDFIMKYVGIPVEPKPHIAINGAVWETEAFSRLIKDAPLLDQFRGYKIPWK